MKFPHLSILFIILSSGIFRIRGNNHQKGWPTIASFGSNGIWKLTCLPLRFHPWRPRAVPCLDSAYRMRHIKFQKPTQNLSIFKYFNNEKLSSSKKDYKSIDGNYRYLRYYLLYIPWVTLLFKHQPFYRHWLKFLSFCQSILGIFNHQLILLMLFSQLCWFSALFNWCSHHSWSKSY